MQYLTITVNLEEDYDDHADSMEMEVNQRSDVRRGRGRTANSDIDDDSGDIHVVYDSPQEHDTRAGPVDRRTSMSPQENTDTVLIEYDMVFKKDMWDQMQVKRK